MPRPSLKDQRSAEILDAYLTCVAKFGLDGATQERIAAEAGVKRPLLRHYLGNRDEMVAALAQHVVGAFAETTEQLRGAIPLLNTPKHLVDLLFDYDTAGDPRLMLAWQALTATVSEHPDMRGALLGAFGDFVDVVEQALGQTAPNSNPQVRRAVALGVASSVSNLDAMSPLSPPEDWRKDLRRAAILLTTSLEAS